MGDKIEVAVRLRKKGGGASLERFVLPVPHDWAGGEVHIVAAGVEQAEKMARRLAGELRPDDLGDIVRWLSERRADGQLYLLATRDGTGMRAGVDVLPFVPPSVLAAVSGSPVVAERTRGLAYEARRERPGVVSGSAPAVLRVLNN